MNDRPPAVERFYALLHELENRCGGRRRLVECDRRMKWPNRGVYFFFEDGEVREDGSTPRVVRVGTHALRESSSTLRQRLSQHKGNTAGSLPGGGNHRGSVFRLHVGTALLATQHWPERVRETWGVANTAPRDTRLCEYPLEKMVSTHIGSMPFLWLKVDDPPSPNSHRGIIEAGSIALLSNFDRPAVDRPSVGWLGHHAQSELVRRSGLWNVNHVRMPPEPSFLTILEQHVRLMHR